MDWADRSVYINRGAGGCGQQRPARERGIGAVGTKNLSLLFLVRRSPQPAGARHYPLPRRPINSVCICLGPVVSSFPPSCWSPGAISWRRPPAVRPSGCTCLSAASSSRAVGAVTSTCTPVLVAANVQDEATPEDRPPYPDGVRLEFRDGTPPEGRSIPPRCRLHPCPT